MNICVVSLGKTLDSPISPRFGRAPYFLFLDENGDLIDICPNAGIRAMRGAGIAAAQEIASKKAGVLITGNIGPNAFDVLSTAGVKIFFAPFNLTVKQVFLMWKKNQLTQLKIPSVPGHFQRGFGSGFGKRRRHRHRHRGGR